MAGRDRVPALGPRLARRRARLARGRRYRLHPRRRGLRARTAAALAGDLRRARPLAPLRLGRQRLPLRADAAVRRSFSPVSLMTDEQKFFFDLKGWPLLPGVLAEPKI